MQVRDNINDSLLLHGQDRLEWSDVEDPSSMAAFSYQEVSDASFHCESHEDKSLLTVCSNMAGLQVASNTDQYHVVMRLVDAGAAGGRMDRSPSTTRHGSAGGPHSRTRITRPLPRGA